MSVVGQVLERVERMAYVRFERIAKESKAASLEAGRWVGVDIDMALITPPDSKDEVVKTVTSWIEQMEQQVAAGRLPREWRDRYLAQYEAWKKGEELPVHGTPIKGWGVISPAQQEACLRANYRTVEDLSLMTEEGSRMIGMGAMEMKRKAAAWLAQLNDKGPLTLQMSAVQRENEILKGSVESLERQVAELVKRLETTAPTYTPPPAPGTITASDLIDDEPPKKGKR
jgi:hypothetical protein